MNARRDDLRPDVKGDKMKRDSERDRGVEDREGDLRTSSPSLSTPALVLSF